jgi:hypothetical protein
VRDAGCETHGHRSRNRTGRTARRRSTCQATSDREPLPGSSHTEFEDRDPHDTAMTQGRLNLIVHRRAEELPLQFQGVAQIQAATHIRGVRPRSCGLIGSSCGQTRWRSVRSGSCRPDHLGRRCRLLARPSTHAGGTLGTRSSSETGRSPGPRTAKQGERRGTLSVTDALRVFSIRTMVAARDTPRTGRWWRPSSGAARAASSPRISCSDGGAGRQRRTGLGPRRSVC